MNTKVAQFWPERMAKAERIDRDEMSWISDLRNVDTVKASMRDRINRATTQRELVKIARYCEDVATAFQVIGDLALRKETK